MLIVVIVTAGIDLDAAGPVVPGADCAIAIAVLPASTAAAIIGKLLAPGLILVS